MLYWVNVRKDLPTNLCCQVSVTLSSNPCHMYEGKKYVQNEFLFNIQSMRIKLDGAYYR
jgi:hypothetical protein